MKTKFEITGMGCTACSTSVEKAVKKIEGVANASVSLLTNSMVVFYDENITNDEAIINAVKEAGYGASVEETDDEVRKARGREEFTKTRNRFFISSVACAVLLYFHFAKINKWPLDCALSGYIQLGLAVLLMIINRGFFVRAFKSLIHGSLGMDLLVSVGSLSSFIYSTYLVVTNAETEMYYFESAGMVLTLVTLGKVLESKAKSHTMDALYTLVEMCPSKVTVKRDGEKMTINAKDIKIGDKIAVRTGDRVPADGVVEKGTGCINLAMLTGEELPRDVFPDSEVKAGSLCTDGFFTLVVNKEVNETQLSKMIEEVKASGTKKAGTQRLADKVCAVFVPLVLMISVVTYIIWMLKGALMSEALNYAISVLVISCPCALGLATPCAIMVGIGNAALHGIVVKSPESMEKVVRVNAVTFDKTGTLTKGEPEVVDVVTASGVDADEMMFLAARLESQSNHPYAKAIRSYGLTKHTAFEMMEKEIKDATLSPGGGVEGEVDGIKMFCGNELLMHENGVDISGLEEVVGEMYKAGYGVVYVATNKLLGIIAISDSIRDEARETVTTLKKEGYALYILSGDTSNSAARIGAVLGMEPKSVIVGALPTQKGKVLEGMNKIGHISAFVGDGVNDAYVLQQADIGIAVGSASDVAIEAADFVLMRNNLMDVPYVLKLSRRVLRVILFNLIFAFLYNIVAIPVAAGVFSGIGLHITPAVSAMAMCLSSLLVVMNALSIREKGKKEEKNE